MRSVAQEAANVKSGARSNCENLSVLLRAKGSDADEGEGDWAILIVGPNAGIKERIKEEECTESRYTAIVLYMRSRNMHCNTNPWRAEKLIKMSIY